MKYVKLILFTAAIILPLKAHAFSILPTSNISNGGSYDIASGPFFWGANFTSGDGPGSVSFVFGNSSIPGGTTATTEGTLLQFTGSLNGMTASWSSGDFVTVLPSTPVGNISVSSFLALGASDILTISWGAVTGSRAPLDLEIAASTVPLPASGALLISGLVGIGALRWRTRKRSRS